MISNYKWQARRRIQVSSIHQILKRIIEKNSPKLRKDRKHTEHQVDRTKK